MGTIGKEVKKLAGDKLPCEDLKLSTCKITKVGIGGPIVNIVNGLFAGMNFYGEIDETPYLPRAIIVEVLNGIDLPSQSGMDHATDIMGDTTVKNRWLSHIATIPYLMILLYVFMEGNSSNPIYLCASSTA